MAIKKYWEKIIVIRIKKACWGIEIMPVHPHVSGGLKKLFDFFKANEIPRDILISVGSAITGAFLFDRILRRDEDQDEDQDE